MHLSTRLVVILVYNCCNSRVAIDKLRFIWHTVLYTQYEGYEKPDRRCAAATQPLFFNELHSTCTSSTILQTPFPYYLFIVLFFLGPEDFLILLLIANLYHIFLFSLCLSLSVIQCVRFDLFFI